MGWSLVAYRGRYGADSGGGFTESIALDPQTAGQYCAGGDTWGMRVSTSWGNEWWGSMSGLAALQNPPHARSVFFSKRAATPGLRFYGTGANGSTGGTFYYALPGSFVVNPIGGSGNGFGLGLGATSGVNGTARRPCGQLIDSYMTGGDAEYIFTLTRGGLDMFTNSSGASGIAAKAAAISGTPTSLLTSSDIGDQQRLFVEVLDATRLVVINWDHNVTNTAAQQTDVYLVYTTATNWATATSSNTHALGPVSITPPKGRVYEIHRGKDGNLYAAAGYDGVYTVTLSGTGASSALAWSKPSGQTADVIVCSVDADSTGVVWAGQCAGSTGGTNYSDSTTGMPNGHSVLKGSAGHTSWTYPASGSAIHFTEYKAGDTTTGTGRTWWLSTRTTPLGQPNHDVAMIRVDPFDDQKVILCGRSGAWMTRNGGSAWYPAMSGLNGGQTGGGSPHIVTTGPSSWSADNTDFGEAHTSDNWATAVKGTTYSPAGGRGINVPQSGSQSFQGDDGKTYVFTAATASAPAKLTQNGTKISDDRFEGAIIAASSMAVSQNGTVGIFQNGGATFVMDPTGGSGGGGGTTAPTITSFTPTTQSVGSTVTVTGSGFTGTTAVKVNATSVVSYSVLDDGTLTLTVPVGATTGAISVTANGLTGTSATALNVTGAPPASPTVNTTGGVSPLSGAPGATITITGTNLGSATAVKIGGSSGLAVSPVSNTSTQITFRIPVGATSGQVYVQTTGGSVTSAETLTVLASPPPIGETLSNLPQGALSRTATMQVRAGWTTDAQARQVAQECVFISGPLTMTRLATVMNTNPSIIIAPYLKSIQNPNGTSDYDAAGTKYPNKWYVHRRDGTKAAQTGQFLNWLMESGYWPETHASASQTGPLSAQLITAASWAEHHVKDAVAAVNRTNAQAAQSGTNPFRGLWFDSNDTFSADASPGFWTVTNPGWNPHTNAAYTKPDFVSMAHYIGDMAQNQVVAGVNPNNLWTVANGLRSISIADHYDMAMAEGWMVSGGLGGPLVKTTATYEARLQLVLDCQARGCVAELLEWALAADTAAAATQKRRYAAASYLIAHRGLATFEFSQPKNAAPWLETAKDPNLYALSLGLPLNGESTSLASDHRVAVGAGNGQASTTGLYSRLYDGGIVLVNPTSAAITYKADRAYTVVPSLENPATTSYSIGNSISVASGSAFIATSTASGSAPANTYPPYILNSLVEGQTLRRDEGVWTGNPNPVFTDQWQVSPNGSTGWADIAGGTNPTFTIPFGTGGTSSTTIAADTYARTVATGWGTADTGGAYTVQQGVAADFSVSATGSGSSGGFVRTLDEQAGGTSSTTLVLTIPTGGVPTGHTIIVAAGANNKNVTGVTDTAGNTYTQDASGLPGTAVSLNVFSAKVTTGLSAGNTITITYAGSVAGRVGVACEYQGFLTSSWNDTATTHVTSSTATTNTTSSNTASAATAQANEIVVSAIIIGAGGSAVGTPTSDAAYTLRATDESTGTIRRIALQSKKDSAIETPIAAWSWGSGNAYVHALTTYKLVGSTASVGLVNHSAANTGKMITLAVNQADVDVYWDSNFPTTATGGNLQSSVMVRWQDANNYLDLNAFLSSGTGGVTAAPRKVIAGTATSLGTGKNLGTYSSSDYIHYRLKTTGSRIQAKIWVGSASEPGAWDWDLTDSSITTAGAIGARSFKGAANTTPNPITEWDNLSAMSVTATVAGYVTDYFRDNVTGTNANGAATVASGVVGPVTSGATGEPQWTTLPSINGSPAEGQILTANPGTLTGTPTPSLSYQWQTSSDGAGGTWSDVAGATTQTWSIPTGSTGLYSRAKVTASNTAATVFAYTPKIGAITGNDALPQFTSPPSIAGSPMAGQTLAMSVGVVTGSPVPVITQVWQSSPDAGVTWVTTSNTDTTYLLNGLDVGALIRVAVLATNRVGQTQALSDPVGPIQPAVSSGTFTIGVTVE